MEYYSAIKRKNLIHTIWTSNTLCKKPIPEDYMILFIWHSGKGKTIGRWNGSVVAWLGLGVEVTFNHKVIAQGDFGGDRTILYPVWGDCYVNPFTYWNSQNAHQEKCEFTTALYASQNPLFPHIIVEILVKSIWRWKCAVLGWNRKPIFLFLTSFHPTKHKCPKP